MKGLRGRGCSTKFRMSWVVAPHQVDQLSQACYAHTGSELIAEMTCLPCQLEVQACYVTMLEFATILALAKGQRQVLAISN